MAASLKNLGLPFLGRDHRLRPGTPEEAEFRREQEPLDVETWRLLMMVIALLMLIWWPTDLLLFRNNPDAIEAFARMRLRLVVLFPCCALVLTYIEPIRRHGMLFLSMCGFAGVVIVAEAMGSLGGPGSGWFHMVGAMLIAPAAVSFRLWQRIAVTLAWLGAMIIGCCVLHPGNWGDPMLAPSLSFLSALVLFTIASGEVLDGWREQTFRLKRAVSRQARELADLNGTLEQRVAQQTAELRDLARNLESARETERSYISRELHDELGQELTALRYELRFARLRYEKEPGSIAPNLGSVEKLLDRTAQTTRNIVADLRPRVLDDLGLCAAAEWLVQRTRDRTGLTCSLEMNESKLQAIPPETATVAFRILQESLTNVARHSEATKVSVSVLQRGDDVEIVVQDNGRGVRPAPPGTRRGAGVIGMRERAATIHGTLEIRSEEGRGTTVHARLPLSASVPVKVAS